MTQKGAIQSRRKTFQFQPDASKIEKTDLAFEQRKEFMHGVSDDDLRTYIMSEALKCQGERMEDVSVSIILLEQTDDDVKRAAIFCQSASSFISKFFSKKLTPFYLSFVCRLERWKENTRTCRRTLISSPRLPSTSRTTRPM